MQQTSGSEITPRGTRCPVCQNQNTKPVSTVRDNRKGVAGAWVFHECGDCGLLFQWPMPTENALSSLYGLYYSGEGTAPPQRARRLEWAPLRNLVRRLRGDVDPRVFITPVRGQRLLDYGCGKGDYLSYFQDRGLSAYGVDVSETAVASCQTRGLRVQRIDIGGRLPFEDASFDVVIMMQVLEHVMEPEELLAEIRRVLKQGGTLYLAMPNAESVWRRFFRNSWASGWFAPFHLLIYSHKASNIMFARCGFSVQEAISTTSVPWLALNLRCQWFGHLGPVETSPIGVWRKGAIFFAAVLLRIVDIFLPKGDCWLFTLKVAQ